MERLSVVIVNWNGKNDTVACLRSLRKLNTQGYDMRVYVIDNGSTDDSVTVIRREYDWTTVIETGENLGFSGGTNVGIRRALRDGALYIWLLNNDTIAHRDALSLLTVFSDARVGIAGSKIYFAPGKEYHHDRYTKSQRGKAIWYAGGLIDWANMYASHRGVDAVDEGQFDVVMETPFITGCSMFVRREVFDAIGLLDERYYLYLEDVDFCLRAARHGFRMLFVPSSVIWHIGAGSSGGAGNPLHDYYITRNRLLIGSRYAPLRTKLALIREAVRYVFGNSTVRRRAVLDAFFGRFGRRYEPRKFHR